MIAYRKSTLCIVIVMCYVYTMTQRTAHGDNVLFSAFYGEGSHFMAAAAVGEGLVRRGHNVTFLISNAFEHRATDPTYSNFSFEIFNHPVPVKNILDLFYTFNTIAFENAVTQVISMMQLLSQQAVDDCEVVLTDAALMKRLEEMDAIVMDLSWPCALLIRALHEQNTTSTRDVSMIVLSPTTPFAWLLRWAGSPFIYACEPEMTTGFSNKMNLLERTQNVVVSYTMLISYLFLSAPLWSRIYDKIGLNHDYDLVKAFQNFDLYLQNVDFSSDFPYALTPNVIPVGGLTARPATGLIKELEDFMQSSGDDGVVVFSLGTYFASITTTRPEISAMFAEAFRRLPQKVIWQLKDGTNADLPANVKAMPWIPQNDLLGHPKTRVFMYHGGNNGFQEASYHGVPVVVIPLLGDQYDVAARVEARGMGRKMDKHYLSADLIYDTLTEVINNPSYAATAKQVSAINRDQPMSATDRAAFWIEHVMKYGGAHLKSPANELSFIQYHLIDVFALLATVFITICVVIYFILKFCFRLCCRLVGKTGVKPKND